MSPNRWPGDFWNGPAAGFLLFWPQGFCMLFRIRYRWINGLYHSRFYVREKAARDKLESLAAMGATDITLTAMGKNTQPVGGEHEQRSGEQIVGVPSQRGGDD